MLVFDLLLALTPAALAQAAPQEPTPEAPPTEEEPPRSSDAALAQVELDAKKAEEQAAAFQLALGRLTGPLAPLAPAIVARREAEDNVFILTQDAWEASGWLLAVHEDRRWKKLIKGARGAPVVADDGYTTLLGELCADEAIRVDVRWGFCAAVWRSYASAGIQDWRHYAILSKAAADYGDPEAAYTAAFLARELSPGDPERAYVLATYAARAQKPAEAATAVDLAMRLEMREDEVAAVALAIGRQGEVEMALQLLGGALLLRPESGVLPACTGMLAAQAGDTDRALILFARAENAGYAAGDLQIAWGDVLTQLGRPDAALERYRKAVAINPALIKAVPEAIRTQL